MHSGPLQADSNRDLRQFGKQFSLRSGRQRTQVSDGLVVLRLQVQLRRFRLHLLQLDGHMLSGDDVLA